MTPASLPRLPLGDIVPIWQVEVPDGLLYAAFFLAGALVLFWLTLVFQERNTGRKLGAPAPGIITLRPTVRKVFWLVVLLGLLVFWNSSWHDSQLYHQRLYVRRMMRDLAKVASLHATTADRVQAFPAQKGASAHTAALMILDQSWDLDSENLDRENLNDASWYVFWGDPKAAPAFPKFVGKKGSDGKWEMDPDFARATLSVEFAASLPPDAPPKTTPVVWMRGLLPDGKLAPDSPTEGQIGGIGFLDGQVEVFDELSIGPGGTSLVKYGTNTPTVNILEALPPGAVILPAEPAASK